MTDSYPATLLELKQQTANSLDELMDKMAEAAAEPGGCPAETVRKMLADSTPVLGSGLALLHVRFEKLEQLTAILCRVRPTADLGAEDGLPIGGACMVLIPESKPNDALHFMADLIGVVRQESSRTKLRKSRTIDDVRDLLYRFRAGRDHNALTAADVMIKPRAVVTPDMELREATRIMAAMRMETIPVIEGRVYKGLLIGRKLCTLGLPDFFGQLKSVGFIRRFDPFEKYFEIEKSMTVGEAMSPEFQGFPTNTTLIEVIYELSVRQAPLAVLVDDDGEIAGVVSPELLLERVLNL